MSDVYYCKNTDRYYVFLDPYQKSVENFPLQSGIIVYEFEVCPKNKLISFLSWTIYLGWIPETKSPYIHEKNKINEFRCK